MSMSERHSRYRIVSGTMGWIGGAECVSVEDIGDIRCVEHGKSG